MPPAASAKAKSAPASAPVADKKRPQPQELAFVGEPFRQAAPKSSDPRPFQAPPIKTFTLKNGLQVYLIEQHALPIISVDLNFDGGSRNDPPGKEGLASVCMDMLTEGTQELDKLAFHAALADIGSEVSSYASEDTQGVRMSTLTKHLPRTVELFAAALLKPGMRQAELDRMIQRRLDQLKQVKGEPSSVASRVSDAVLFGGNHPYGRLTTERAYQAIKLADCKRYHGSLKPGGARLFVVGDMTEETVRKYFDSESDPGLAGFIGRQPAQKPLPRPAPARGNLFFLDVPGATQSRVLLMHFGPKRQVPEHTVNAMMAAILGGGFTSRINMNLREGKGYSYGAGGGFTYTRDYGVFRMFSSVRADTTYQTVLELLDEMRALKTAARPPLGEELTREQNSDILGLPSRFATARQALGTYRELVYYNLPLDYYATHMDRLRAVTLDQVSAAAKAQLRPEEAKIIVVGDGSVPVIHRVDGADTPLTKNGAPMTLRDALRELAKSGALGSKAELVVINADGKPVR